MQTIMLCLNKLGIGGLETAVLNQTIELIRRKYKVIILAADGIYRERFEQEGAIFVEFEYKLQNNYEIEKISVVANIIEKYKVNQVHIHQFDCINPVFLACIIKNIPYVAYIHCGILNVYDYFENLFPCYKIMFSMYFGNATKIIAIRETAKQENIKRYGIDESKYLVIKNSIDFNRFKVIGNKIPTKIEKFLIISRFTTEKEKSIINAILLFKEYYKKNKNARLTIVGDGTSKEIIEKELSDIKSVTKMLGEKSNVAEIIAKHDIIIGLDRCILETITMKKLAVISGYDGLKALVTKDNILKASDENFGGANLENNDVKNVVEKLLKLNKETIKEIVEDNYQFAYKNLNINNNIFILNDTTVENKLNSNIINNIILLQNLYVEKLNYAEKVYSDCKKEVEYYKNQINGYNQKIKDLENEQKKYYIQEKNYKEQINNKDREINELNKKLDALNNTPLHFIKNKLNKLKK